ncbi:hypothetical protein AVEN_231034-1 [Araneus ventricosus]|uniref:Uncharacterized protein n=1 Tax=Araneus ventricosus TaxID=182803 RepID=A0A4Y2A445_ARAVE|nr:hypothetical protein AVEN_231034-1 [Araneus ventricosus]
MSLHGLSDVETKKGSMKAFHPFQSSLPCPILWTLNSMGESVDVDYGHLPGAWWWLLIAVKICSGVPSCMKHMFCCTVVDTSCISNFAIFTV